MKTLKTLAGSVLSASFVFSPAALVLAEEATVTGAPEATAVVSTTSAPVPTLYMRDGVQDINEAKREAVQKIEENRREAMQKINEQKREALKDLKEKVKGEREDQRASSTAKREEVRKERREEMMKRQMASTTEKLSVLSERLAKLGVDIKAAVSAQASSSVVITGAMTKEEARSAFKTFLIGANYKNLGQLVSEASKTNARINQIENQISKMASTSDKTALVASLAELKTQAATVEQYVKDNEGKFSLFGWFAKRFNK